MASVVVATPNDIKQRLMDGNKRYVADIEDLDSSKDLRIKVVAGQQPFAIILSCADSRVVPEMIFDCNIGELFVIRVAGNIANKCSIASIEYAVAHLGCKLIFVLGHQSCGAVTAAVNNNGKDNGSTNLNHLCSHIEEAVKTSSKSACIDDVVKLNAIINANNLIKNSNIIQNNVKNKNLEICAGYYSLSNGHVDIFSNTNQDGGLM